MSIKHPWESDPTVHSRRFEVLRFFLCIYIRGLIVKFSKMPKLGKKQLSNKINGKKGGYHKNFSTLRNQEDDLSDETKWNRKRLPNKPDLGNKNNINQLASTENSIPIFPQVKLQKNLLVLFACLARSNLFIICI